MSTKMRSRDQIDMDLKYLNARDRLLLEALFDIRDLLIPQEINMEVKPKVPKDMLCPSYGKYLSENCPQCNKLL